MVARSGWEVFFFLEMFLLYFTTELGHANDLSAVDTDVTTKIEVNLQRAVRSVDLNDNDISPKLNECENDNLIAWKQLTGGCDHFYKNMLPYKIVKKGGFNGLVNTFTTKNTPPKARMFWPHKTKKPTCKKCGWFPPPPTRLGLKHTIPPFLPRPPPRPMPPPPTRPMPPPSTCLMPPPPTRPDLSPTLPPFLPRPPPRPMPPPPTRPPRPTFPYPPTCPPTPGCVSTPKPCQKKCRPCCCPCKETPSPHPPPPPPTKLTPPPTNTTPPSPRPTHPPPPTTPVKTTDDDYYFENPGQAAGRYPYPSDCFLTTKEIRNNECCDLCYDY